ncbi:TPA: reverse transcriptase family protein [Photobacterium damselae]
MKRKKLKIQTNNKSYSLPQSPFFRLKSKKLLANTLLSDLHILQQCRVDEGYYSQFDTKGKAGKLRAVQCPCNGLEKIHSRIASLLCRLDTPSYLQSGKKGLSNVTNAREHCNSNKLITADIKSFFTSTSREMVFKFFRHQMECSPDVSDLLADLCTCNGHVPTGSQLSMPLAFWTNNLMFKEINLLAQKHKVKMTLYVDDLSFSGKQANKLFISTVSKIVSRHGLQIHPDKTRIYNGDSAKLLTGVIIRNNQLLVRNEQHCSLHSELECWKAIKDTHYAMSSNTMNKLLGRLNAMSAIEPKYKDKVKTLRQATKKPA